MESTFVRRGGVPSRLDEALLIERRSLYWVRVRIAHAARISWCRRHLARRHGAGVSPPDCHGRGFRRFLLRVDTAGCDCRGCQRTPPSLRSAAVKMVFARLAPSARRPAGNGSLQPRHLFSASLVETNSTTSADRAQRDNGGTPSRCRSRQPRVRAAVSIGIAGRPGMVLAGPRGAGLCGIA